MIERTLEVIGEMGPLPIIGCLIALVLFIKMMVFIFTNKPDELKDEKGKSCDITTKD